MIYFFITSSIWQMYLTILEQAWAMQYRKKIHDHFALIISSHATQSAPPSVMITETVSGPTILTSKQYERQLNK